MQVAFSPFFNCGETMRPALYWGVYSTAGVKAVHSGLNGATAGN